MNRVSHKLLVTCLKTLRFSTLAGVLIFCQIGCDTQPKTTGRAVAEAPLRFVGQELIAYARLHGGASPKSREEFIEYLEENKAAWAHKDVSSAEELLISPFDGQPIVIVPASKTGPTDSTGYRILAFESEGSGGQRWVVNERGGVVQIDSKKLDEMFPNLK